MQKVDLVIREETLENERRTVITPDQVAQLTNQGFSVALAKWDERIYHDDDYVDAVNRLGDSDNFKVIDPEEWTEGISYENSVILGVKEIIDHHLGDKQFDLDKTYVHFDHSFKGQDGSDKRLSRFGNEPEGVDVVLLDHEYCVDDDGVRTHAFGKSAGYSTAAISFLMWANKTIGESSELPKYSYDSKEEFFEQNIANIELAVNENGGLNSLVLGGEHGRSAKGATEFYDDLRSRLNNGNKLSNVRWGREETEEKQQRNGLDGINDFDVVVNCTFTEDSVPPFMNDKTLQERNDDTLQVIGDVTCDTTPDKNRVRFSDYKTTDFDDPIHNVGKNVHIVTIDHSPSFFPKEATDDISKQFFPQIIDLLEARKQGMVVPENSPWERSLEAFEENMLVPVNAYYMGKNVSVGFDMVSMSEEEKESYLENNHDSLEKLFINLLSQMDELSEEEKDSFMFHVSTGFFKIHEDNNKFGFKDNRNNAELGDLVTKMQKSLEGRFPIEDLCQSPEVVNAHELSKVVSDQFKDPEFLNVMGYEDEESFVEAFKQGDITTEMSLYLEYTEAARSVINACEDSIADVSEEFAKAKNVIERTKLFPKSVMKDVGEVVASHEEELAI
ncbi:MAG: hypothetical protein ACRBB3_06395 [Alphaproteobacteria bacterium]